MAFSASGAKQPVMAFSPNLYNCKLHRLVWIAGSTKAKVVLTGDYLRTAPTEDKISVLNAIVDKGGIALASYSDVVFFGTMKELSSCEASWNGKDFALPQFIHRGSWYRILSTKAKRFFWDIAGKIPLDPSITADRDAIYFTNWMRTHLRPGFLDVFGNFHTNADPESVFTGWTAYGNAIVSFEKMFSEFLDIPVNDHIARLFLSVLVSGQNWTEALPRDRINIFAADLCAKLRIKRMVCYPSCNFTLKMMRSLFDSSEGRIIAVPSDITSRTAGKGGFALFGNDDLTLFNYRPGAGVDFERVFDVPY